jgi:hypothetical protein
MMKLHRISVQDNTVLQTMVLSQLQDLAGGIELLEPGLSSEAGPLCLAIDPERHFVLLIPVVHEEDALLVRALAQMSWVHRHQSLLVRLFPKRGLEPARPTRAVLIAPGFSAALQQAVSLINLDVELVQYRALEFGQQKMLMFEPVGVPRRKAVPAVAAAPVLPLDSRSHMALSDAERDFFEGASPKSLPT